MHVRSLLDNHFLSSQTYSKLYLFLLNHSSHTHESLNVNCGSYVRPTRPRVSYRSHSIQKSDSSYSSQGPRAPIALLLSSKNNPSFRYLYLNQRRYYFVWLYKVLEIYIIIILWLPVLYRNNYPDYPNRNTGIELFVVLIILIVTGIYDSRWRVF